MADAQASDARAKSPADFSWAAWKAILLRVWNGNGEHNLSLMAAGVAFYAFLSFVPLLGALVMSYGLVADPATISEHMKTVIDLVPADAAGLAGAGYHAVLVGEALVTSGDARGAVACLRHARR